jgi:hypothetical protein
MRIEILIGALLAHRNMGGYELFDRQDASQLWEVIKLIIQFIGALLIARLTVQWAMGRFKSEKNWDARPPPMPR